MEILHRNEISNFIRFQEFIFEGEEFRQAKFDWLRRVDQYYNEKEKDGR